MNGYDKSSVTLSGLANGNYDDVVSSTAEIQTLTVGGASFIPGNYVTLPYLNSQLANYALASILTGCSYNSSLGAFQIGGTTDCRILNKLYLQINGSSTDINAYIGINDTNISNLQQVLIGCTHDNSLGAFVLGGTLDLRLSGGTLYLKINGSPADIGNYITNNILNINSLTSKTTNQSYNSNSTNFSGTLEGDVFTFNTSINGTSKAKFNNIMNTCFDISGNCQAQITAAQATGTAAGVAVAATDIAVAAIAADLVLTNAALVLTDGNVATNSTDITTLESKTQTYSYNVTDNVVNISSRVNCNSFGGIIFNGSLNQNNVNAQNDLYGNTYYHNHLRSADGAAIFAQGVDATGDLSIAGTSSLNGNVTCGGATTNLNSTTTQIGVSSTSALNVNSSSNFYGATKIQDNATTSTGLISPYLNVLSSSSNTNARKLQGVCVGVQQVLNNQCNANFGYNYVSDGNVGNFGYLGLNVGTLNIIDSLRWYSTKVVIQTGNFEVVNNTTITGSLICNTINNSGAANSAPLAITATGTNNNVVITSAANTNLFGTAVKLNSNDVQIGSNQGAAVNNTVLIGSITSNTTTNIPNGIKTNYINPYNTATAVAINGAQINIGTAQPAVSLNTVNIGSISAASIINLNGIVNSPFGMNITGIFTQF